MMMDRLKKPTMMCHYSSCHWQKERGERTQNEICIHTINKWRRLERGKIGHKLHLGKGSREIRKCARHVLLEDNCAGVRREGSSESRACIADKEAARFMVIKCQHLDLYSASRSTDNFITRTPPGNKFAPR
jgi:hypothetical protein